MRHPEHPAIIQTWMLTMLSSAASLSVGADRGAGEPVGRYKSHTVTLVVRRTRYLWPILPALTLTPSWHLLFSTGRGPGVFCLVTRIYISVEQSVLCCVSPAVSIFQLLSSLVMIMNTAGASSRSSRIIKSPGGSLHFFMWSLLSSPQVSWQLTSQRYHIFSLVLMLLW